MFNLIFKNGYELKAEHVQEGLRYFNETADVIFTAQYTSSDKLDILEIETKIREGIEEIKVMEDGNLVDTITNYSKIVSINKSIRPSEVYFYDIQLSR